MKNWFGQLPQDLVRIAKKHKGLKYPILLLLLLGMAICNVIDAVKALAQSQMRRRIMASALAFCMVFTLLLATAFAAEALPGASTLCEHHTEHTQECDYAEAVEGTPCGFVPDAPEEASPSEAVEPETEPTVHVHDEECGYIEAVEGMPCGFVCEICSEVKEEPPADSGTAQQQPAPLSEVMPIAGETTTWAIGSPTAADVTATLSADKTTLAISGTGKMKGWASKTFYNILCK